MCIKKSVSVCVLLLGVAIATILAGCSDHNNPLNTATPEVAAKFLVAASQSAEKTLRVFNAPGGYYYGECMNGNVNRSLCEKLYMAMVNYAKNTTHFRGITVDELMDKNVFKHLKANYQREQFNAV